MAKGWIKLHRQIKECWIYEEKPFDRTHAWIDLLVRANHQEKKISLGNELIDVKKGSLITSELKLMEAWGWSKTKTRSFLKLLQNDGMIEIITDKKKTTINIVNYSVYQESENQEKTIEKPQEDHEETTKEPRKDTNKNDKELKNDKNDKEVIYMSDSIEHRLSEYLFNMIKANNEKAKKPNIQSWCKEFDKILRIDKREIKEVEEVISWAQHNNFWYKNILSPNKLREKYDTLYMQMKGDRNGSKNTPGVNSKFEGYKAPKPKLEGEADYSDLI